MRDTASTYRICLSRFRYIDPSWLLQWIVIILRDFVETTIHWCLWHYARSNYAIEVIRREQIGQVCCEWIYWMWFKWTLKADVTPFCSLFTFWRRRSQKSNACASWEPIYTTSSVRCHLFTKNSARLQKNVSNSYTCTAFRANHSLACSRGTHIIDHMLCMCPMWEYGFC